VKKKTFTKILSKNNMQSVYPSPEPILVNLLRLKKPIFCPVLSVPCQQMRQKTEEAAENEK
jgi:hypothetical protein